MASSGLTSQVQTVKWRSLLNVERLEQHQLTSCGMEEAVRARTVKKGECFRKRRDDETGKEVEVVTHFQVELAASLQISAEGDTRKYGGD